MFLANLGAIYNAVFLAIYQTNKISKSLQSSVHYNSMDTYISLLILLFLVQYYSHSVSLASSNETDQQALLAFRNFITSPSHFWRVIGPKILLFALGSVSLAVQKVIDVSIPTNLFQHRRVQVISLAFNKLGGEMWKGPWYVPELRVLNMGNNSLTGIIPPSVNFGLSGNRISGNIPKDIAFMCI
ncbi:hypothetical protein P3S68_030674 [Capsicum galapagoense]